MKTKTGRPKKKLSEMSHAQIYAYAYRQSRKAAQAEIRINSLLKIIRTLNKKLYGDKKEEYINVE